MLKQLIQSLKFIDIVKQLSFIKRWSNKFFHNHQNVAEHSFYVAHFCLLLGRIEKRHGNKVDMAKLLTKALVHDLPEALTGDILNPTKTHNEKIHKMIEEVEKELLQEHIFNHIEPEYYDDFTKILNGEKDESIEGMILAAADKLDALHECAHEIKTGNKRLRGTYYILLQEILKSPLKSVEIVLSINPHLFLED